MASLKELFHAYATGVSQEELQLLFAESSPIVVSLFISKLEKEASEDDHRRNQLLAALHEMRLQINEVHSALDPQRRRT